jgi:uncharacterized protein YjbJ (UPF0337 family)
MTVQAMMHAKEQWLSHRGTALLWNSSRWRALLGKQALPWMTGFVITVMTIFKPQPAMATTTHAPSLTHIGAKAGMLATMTNKAKAAAEVTEGKLESAYGDLSGKVENQVKGMAKQMQGSAMNVGEDIKDAAKSAAKQLTEGAS